MNGWSWGNLFKPNEQMPRRVFFIVGAAWIVFFLGGWTIAPAIFPTPIEAAHALVNLFRTESLFGHLVVSVVLSLEALLIAVGLSLSIAYGTTLPILRPFARFAGLLRFLTPVGTVFIFQIMVTSNHNLKLALLVFFMSGFLIPAMVDVVSKVEKADYDQCRVLGMSELRTNWEVVVRGTFDQALDSIRNVAAIGWGMLCTVEGLARSQGGIGVLLMNQDKHFILAAVFALNFVLLACGFGIDNLLILAKRKLCPYVFLASERT